MLKLFRATMVLLVLVVFLFVARLATIEAARIQCAQLGWSDAYVDWGVTRYCTRYVDSTQETIPLSEISK